MRAPTKRVSGHYGTVEFHARQGQHKPYRCSTAPSKRLLGTLPKPVPQLFHYEDEPETTPKVKGGGKAKWAQYLGYKTRDSLYGITVKIKGIQEETYWLPYKQAETLWLEIVGTPFQNEIKETLMND